MNCEVYQQNEATVKITYGLYSEFAKDRPYYVHFLSEKASLELWDKCKILIAENLMYWKNEPI